MAEINQVDILVKADVPAIVDNQQLLVYVPVATNSNYGIVKPDGDDLTVENGILKLKEGGSVQQGQLDKKVDKLTNSSALIGDDILKLYAQDNEGQEGYVSGSKGSLENTVAIRTVEGTLKSQRAQTDWDLVPLKQVKEIAQANDTPEAITDSTLDANIGQNAITHKSIEKWTYKETGKSEYVNVDRRIPIIAGKGIKFVKNDDLKAISIYTDLEAKLNENIFKNPEKTYIVWKGANFPNSNTAQTIFDVGTVIDFGDGEAPIVITEALANIKVTHTYFDNTDYHIITITYPNTNARAIRANKYNGCTGLIYILTSRYITSIEEGAFSNCDKLDYLYLSNVNTIGNYAFQGMGTILDIDMPAVTSIGEYCFQGSGYSKHIVFPKLHTISVGALQIFEDVELGPDLEAVTIIKQFALNNCKVLTISDEKQSVLAEQNAFSDKLKRIYVPKSKYSTYISDWVAYYDKIAYKIDSYDLFLELGKCIPDTEKGEANGVATLDASGKVPSSQLPSYVDDVINSYIVGSTPFAADWLSLTAGGSPLTPEEGKIYVIVSEGAYSNNSYRWSGTVYAPVGSPIAVVQQKGQSTEDVMSQKATTDSLNLLEAKLNDELNMKTSQEVFIGESLPTSADAKIWIDTGTSASGLSEIYGVDKVGQANPTLTRTDDAVGLSYTVGASEITSDFDNCYPWRDMQEVTDVSGNVFIKIPKFYSKVTKNTDGTYKHQISGTQHEGFTTLFVDGKGNELDYVLVGKYEGSGSASRVYSKSGATVLVNITRGNFRIGCKANGKGYQQYDFMIDAIIKELFMIEFATTNTQSIMQGYTAQSNVAAVATGRTDTVKTASGSEISNTDGKHACKYRGIENPFGNVWKWCDGINFDVEKIYACEDPEFYADDKHDAPYTYMGDRLMSEGYLKEVTPFAKNPLLGYATAIGAGSTTHYSDYYYVNNTGTVLFCGGYWYDGAKAGLWHWYGYSTASDAGAGIGGRLCYKPIQN